MAALLLCVQVSYQGPWFGACWLSGTQKYIRDIVNVISYTCAFTAMTSLLSAVEEKHHHSLYIRYIMGQDSLHLLKSNINVWCFSFIWFVFLFCCFLSALFLLIMFSFILYGFIVLIVFDSLKLLWVLLKALYK